jgi:hypothetical protein
MPPAPPGRVQRVLQRGAASGVYFFCWAVFCCGCGAPGEPTPPAPPIPAAIADLAAHQIGDGAQLNFTLPGRSVTGARLTEFPAIEVYRGTVKPDGSADAKSFRMVYTVPSSLISNYIVEKHVEFVDPILAEETKLHPGGKIAYLVRTRISAKKASADSNIVEVAIFPVPARIGNVDARVSETAVELSWAAPAQTSGGEALPAFSYRIYRGQLDAPGDQAAVEAAIGAAAKDPLHAKWKAKLTLLASPESNSYRDTDFEFNKTYVYVVRSAVLAGGVPLESAASAPAIVTPKDIFPPAAPQGLVAAVLEGAGGTATAVELSWSISPEGDVAGYRVYRSDRENTRGEALSPDLLPTPAVRDTSVRPGHRYWYTVTAVDRAGNESVPSSPVLVEITQPSS